MRSSQNNENHYTPEELCKTLVQLVDISPDDILLEPFMGDGAFYNHFPEENIKDWCEITKGRDFLEYEGIRAALMVPEVILLALVVSVVADAARPVISLAPS